jgi:tRNA 2-thiocytidine biosynthesis protein TtcA
MLSTAGRQRVVANELPLGAGVRGSEREVDKRITRAILEYHLIEPGDRVLVALSGGKDSLALAWNLARKSQGFPIPFTAEAIHLVTGFGDVEQPERLKTLLAGWGMKLHIVGHPAAAEAAAGRAPSCFGCARDRRRILLEAADEGGFSKIALGHHMNDSLITLLMNMSWNSELAAMPPKVPAAQGAPAIIRPLILLQESTIVRLVNQAGWTADSCKCPWAGDSRRTEFEAVLEGLTGGSPKRTWNIWSSLSNIKQDLLPPG